MQLKVVTLWKTFLTLLAVSGQSHKILKVSSYWKVSGFSETLPGHSKKFLDIIERFQYNLEKFLDDMESFQTLCKVSRHPVKFSDTLENF